MATLSFEWSRNGTSCGEKISSCGEPGRQGKEWVQTLAGTLQLGVGEGQAQRSLGQGGGVCSRMAKGSPLFPPLRDPQAAGEQVGCEGLRACSTHPGAWGVTTAPSAASPQLSAGAVAWIITFTSGTWCTPKCPVYHIDVCCAPAGAVHLSSTWCTPGHPCTPACRVHTPELLGSCSCIQLHSPLHHQALT